MPTCTGATYSSNNARAPTFVLQWLTIHSKIVFIHALLPLQLGMVMGYQYENRLFFRALQPLCPEAEFCGIQTQLGLAVASRSSNFHNFTPR